MTSNARKNQFMHLFSVYDCNNVLNQSHWKPHLSVHINDALNTDTQDPYIIYLLLQLPVIKSASSKDVSGVDNIHGLRPIRWQSEKYIILR